MEYLTKLNMSHGSVSKHFTDAIGKEIVWLSSQNTWECIPAEKVPKNAAIRAEMFDLLMKDDLTGYEIWKFSFVDQGHRDSMSP